MFLKTKYYFKLFIYYCSILLGITIVFLFIYFRFFKERLPKDIPFDLTEVGLGVLIYICCIYIYIIKILWERKKETELSKQFKNYINMLYQPLVNLDRFIKYNKYFKNKYSNYKYNFINYLSIKMSTSLTFSKNIYVIFYIFPRIILITLLIIDIFLIGKISIFYNYIFISILPLIHRYIKFSIKDFIFYTLEYLEKNYREVSLFDKNYAIPGKWELTENNKYHNQEISIKEYFELKTEDLNSDMYDASVILHEKTYQIFFSKKYHKIPENIKKKDFKKLEYRFWIKFNKILLIHNLLHKYNQIIDKFRYFKIVIFSMYFICWFSVLNFSTYTFPVNFEYTLEYLYTILKHLDGEEPFFGFNVLIYYD